MSAGIDHNFFHGDQRSETCNQVIAYGVLNHVFVNLRLRDRVGLTPAIHEAVCQLRTFDGLFLFLPNSSIWNQPLKNHTRNGGRLISVNIGVPATADIARVQQTLVDIAAKTPSALPDRPPKVFIDKVDGGNLILNLMVWSAPQGAGDIERKIIEASKQAIEALGENLKPTQIVRAVPPDSDPSRFLEGKRPVWPYSGSPAV